MDNGIKKPTKKPVSPINGQPVPDPGPGRPKGMPNKATKQAREAIAMFVEGNADRLTGWLDKVAEKKPEEAFKLFMSVVEYHIPKLARQEIVGDPEKPITHKHDHTLKSRILAEIPQEKLEAIAKEVEGAGD